MSAGQECFYARKSPLSLINQDVIIIIIIIFIDEASSQSLYYKSSSSTDMKIFVCLLLPLLGVNGELQYLSANEINVEEKAY